jgi:ABC-2 type transport system permease protein
MALTGSEPIETTPSIIVRVADVVASEWIKVRSVRSSVWLLVIAAVTAIGGSAIVGVSERSSSPPPVADPVASVFLAWLEYPVLAVGILGVLSFTSEYTTGQIRPTFTAVPQRLTVLVAKAGVIGIVALVFAEALAFASFLLCQTILAGHRYATSLADPGVAGNVLAAGFCLLAIAILGLALGAILRTTVAAVASLPALLYLPLITLALPHPWNHTIGKFTLLIAAFQLVSEHSHRELLSVPLSLVVVVAWPALSLTIAGLQISRRDA